MSTTLVFASDLGSVSFVAAPDGFHRVAGAYWLERPVVPPGDYEPQDAEASGVDGVDSPFEGFRGRAMGPYKTIYVANDYAGLMTAYLADRAKLEGITESTISVPDDATSYPGCILDAKAMQAPGMVGAPYETEAYCCLEVTWLFTCRRLAS